MSTSISSRALPVLVAGGGIGGVAAALALAWPRAGTLPTVQNLVQITLTPPHDRPRP